jgi:hypothetical protein
MPRYYPNPRSILLGPVALGLVVAVPFLKRAASRELGIVVFAAGFAVAFALWRWFLSAKVAAGKLYGRHPDKLGHRVLELSAIARVERGECTLGRLRGWVFHGSPDQAVFVVEPALSDPELRTVFDRLVQPGSPGDPR